MQAREVSMIDAPTDLQPHTSQEPGRSATPLSILVVEDEWLIGEDLKLILEELGYKVLGPALTCSAALELIWTEKPDIALVDTQLGSETCEVVLDECRLRNVPVVISSGHDIAMMPEFCRDLPAVTKPYGRCELIERLAALTQV